MCESMMCPRSSMTWVKRPPFAMVSANLVSRVLSARF
jgi:hypothetical protein